MTLLLTAAILFPLHPHTDAELSDWQDQWLLQVEGEGWTETIELAELRQDMIDRHPCRIVECPQPEEVMPTEPRTGEPVAAPPSANRGMGSNVEQWRELVAAYFPAENIDKALAVLGCETGWTGNPSAKNPTSSAAGLFQFLRSTWDRVAVPLGYGSYDSGAVYDPVANVHAASVLSNGGSNWGQWSCKP